MYRGEWYEILLGFIVQYGTFYIVLRFLLCGPKKYRVHSKGLITGKSIFGSYVRLSTRSGETCLEIPQKDFDSYFVGDFIHVIQTFDSCDKPLRTCTFSTRIVPKRR